MKYRNASRLFAALICLAFALPSLWGQTQPFDPGCYTALAQDTMIRSAFINYGNGVKMKNASRRMKLTIGQMVVGSALGDDNNMEFGYWAGFLVAPFPPFVTASQGELLDRIQISWGPNPLGPFAVGGFKIYRDGVYLAAVDKATRNYNDFNVIAGRPYNYEVRGINAYGEGSPGKALGFQVPNGVVTGWVRTLNQSPVPNALVTLMPMQGYSAYFGPLDGATAAADSSTNGDFLPTTDSDWTLCFWIKTSEAINNPVMMDMLPNSGGLGLSIKALTSDGMQISAGGATLSGAFQATSNNWHHVALSYGSGGYRLYLDGLLANLGNGTAILNSETLRVGKIASNNHWVGRLDELRIYHKRLDELDLPEVIEGTASSLTPGLKYYWKMDEQKGSKSFDVLQRTKFYFCGAIFSNDRPPVRTSGMTNEEGYYRIESASYGTGITFLAQAMKNFYRHRALKFIRSEADYATLPDFSLNKKTTLETWVNSAGPDGTQTILSKRWNNNNSFQLQLEPAGNDNNIIFKLNNQAQNFGLLGLGFHHLAFTIDSLGNGTQVNAYKDGTLLGSIQMPPYTGNWSDPTEPWVLGARKSGNSFLEHYGGLIDEIAVYDSLFSQADIQAHFNGSRDPQEFGLRIYYALDEGTGNVLNNSGSLLFQTVGNGFGTEWTIMAANQSTTPHEFTPATRQVTLNPSITSVDQVDFSDRSTIPVFGYVRYKNTDCFAKNVEILVNGESFIPRIFTDSTGKFIIDFEPGTTATLTPKFEDHEFVPAFWQLTNLISPIAGIVFNDITSRKIKGVVAGGDCKLPILIQPDQPSGTVCIVQVRSLDGCLIRQQQLGKLDGDVDGNYEFLNLPPIRMTVAVIEHSDNLIKTAFQIQGGKQVNLTSRDTLIDFIYHSEPQVEIVSGLEPDTPRCNIIVLKQGQLYTTQFRVQEFYLGEGCPLDTAKIKIINEAAGEVIDTTLSNGQLKYKFRAGLPNSSPPFLQNFQVLATSLSGNESSLVKQVLVTGLFQKANTFTTQLPLTPSIVLRDPPGDGSYAYLEKGEQVCQSMSFTLETTNTDGVGVTGVVDVAPNFSVEIGSASWEFGGDVGTEITNITTIVKTSDNSMEVCQSFTERISTSSSDLIVGPAYNVPYLNPAPGDGWIQGGDLFVGSGLNVDFGFADKVDYDTLNCGGITSQVVSISPKNYGTTFIYTDYHIRNNVIRYLNAIANDPGTSPEKRDTCLTSVARWEKILDNNEKQKAAAKFTRNVSFDAGIEYEYAETSDTTNGVSNANSTNSIFNTDVNLLPVFFGAGGGAILHFVNETVKGKSTDNSTSKGITTGYVSADDDPGDAFAIDVAMDSVYKTPVFRTVSGQSSCPWEPKTAHREGNSLELRDGSGAVAIDVPSNEAAVFKFTLGNQSETNENWTYAFTAGPESNPHGAKIFLNGAALDHPVLYAIPFGESIPITVTLERGPEEYDYDDLELVLYSLCEDDRANALGILPDNDTVLYSAVYISAHFIRPCSEVDITVPQQDWVVFPDPITQGPDDVMRITVSDYDKTQAEFDSIRVQYRPTDGDGAWINIVPPQDSLINSIQPGAEITKANLGSTFTQFFWNTDKLADGPYEIRAIALCSGDAFDKPGYSHIIRGRIERQPPSLLGAPQPSDGVYNVGDEISFTFNKHINCAKINPLDNVQLFDATTDQPIDIDITCFENKIVLSPNFQNSFFENKILRAELHDIEDKTGNNLVYEQWEFYVDRNELAWLTDSVGITKFEDENKTAVANIHNRGGSPVPFIIENVPNWVKIVPNQGTLAPNESRPISFTVDSTLAFGLWSDSIVLHTVTGQNPFFMGGDEGLPFGVRVVCRPTINNLNPAQFENTFNMIVALNIEGTLSEDAEDIVVAYMGDTLCGRAKIQFVPQVNKWMAYLTIYGNPNQVLAPLRFEIWDASECLRYAVVEDYFVFQADAFVGSNNAPIVLHTNSSVLRDVPFGFGWNWLSFNLGFPDASLNAALASLKYPHQDLIKGQNNFSVFLNGGGWLGSLDSLRNPTMYIYRADLPDTLKMSGTLIDPATNPIPVVPGWNWIGYLPNYSLPINEALASVPAQAGNVIKSQIAFAEYLNPTYGWIGNLKYMTPPNGYQIKLAAPGSLVYPPPHSNLTGSDNSRPEYAESDQSTGTKPAPNFWTVDPTLYEHSMTLIGMLDIDGANATTSTMEIGAFAGSLVRGSGQAIYIPPMEKYLFFLTAYANASGEQLQFKLYDSNDGSITNLSESMGFMPNLHQGSIPAPMPFTLASTATHESLTEQSFEVQPNPFQNETMFRFSLDRAQDISITVSALDGRTVSSMHTSAISGLNAIVWKARSNSGAPLEPGVYFVRLQTAKGSAVKKVVIK